MADEFWEFERAGWDRASAHYERCWTYTGVFVAPLLDAAGVRAGTRLLDVAFAEHAVPVEQPEGPPVDRYADPGESRRALAATGFDDFEIETVAAPWCAPTPELLFEAHFHAGVIVSGVLRAQPPDRLAAIRAAIVERVRD